MQKKYAEEKLNVWSTSTNVIFPKEDKAVLQNEVATIGQRLKEAESRRDTLVQLMNASPR